LADTAGDARVGMAAHERHCRSLPGFARGISKLPPVGAAGFVANPAFVTGAAIYSSTFSIQLLRTEMTAGAPSISTPIMALRLLASWASSPFLPCWRRL